MDLTFDASAWPGSTGQTETNGMPRSRTFLSNPCNAAWSITGPVKKRIAVFFQRDGQTFKPVCPLIIEVPLDADFIESLVRNDPAVMRFFHSFCTSYIFLYMNGSSCVAFVLIYSHNITINVGGCLPHMWGCMWGYLRKEAGDVKSPAR